MEEIREHLKKTIKNLYDLDFDSEITIAPVSIDADYSTNAPLKLAKTLHQSPMEIAKKIGDEYTASGAHVEVTAPGFLNFKLDDICLFNKINRLYNNFDQEISSDKYKGKTIICEFSDPNPFKVLHVGHLYTSIVGDAISRLFEYAGAKVVRANFGGDVGLHVAKTMYALQQKPLVDLTIEDIARCYIEGTAVYEDDAAARQEITKLNKEIYAINAAGPAQSKTIDNNLAELYWKGRELSYEYFNDFYAKIGVKFDKYYPESTVAALGLAKVKEQLQNGVYELSGGAVIFNGDKFGLHTRVFINKEGVPTYEAKDVGLIFTKWQDYHFDKSIVITGSEQLEYMKVVLKSIEQYAPDLVEKTSHLTHGLVKLPGGVKMSSRKGNFLKAIDVLNIIREELKSAYGSEDEIISLAATKYAFLKYKMGGNIIFDPKESVKMTGNSGPYLLYSAVRAKKILSKKHLSDTDNARQASIYDNGGKLESDSRNDGCERIGERACISITTPERDLIKQLIEYRLLLDEAVSEMAPHKVTNYLYDLAQAFSRFYENCQVLGCTEEQERLKFVQVYLNTMTHGLGLLGINIPEEM